MVNGEFISVGSAFFLFFNGLLFAVTARHVIDGLRSKGVIETGIRMNRTAGEEPPLSCTLNKIDDWHVHSTNNALDVAILPMGFPDKSDHRAITRETVLTEDFMKPQEVGLGDRVVIPGMFKHHTGQKRNMPIVRTGCISAFDDEPVRTSVGDIRAYLMETQSIGGLSGAPVFLDLGLTRSINGKTVTLQGDRMSRFRLMGLVHGHYDETGAPPDRVNTGISIVVPIEDVCAVVDAYLEAR